MKKILIFANTAGGLLHFRAELVERLVLEHNEVCFAVPTPKEHHTSKSLEAVGARHIHVKMKRKGKNPIGDLKIYQQYVQIIKTLKPDVVLTYTIKPNIYGALAAHRYRVPALMNITGLGNNLSKGALALFIKGLYKYSCNRASRIFFQNRSNMEFFLKEKFVNREKATLIPGSGVNLERFKPMTKSNRDDRIRFIFVGRIMREKGIEVYLDVAEKVKNSGLNAEFQILGTFEDPKYSSMIKNHSAVNYLGRSDDVRKEIKEVDCVVLPALYPEGMSNVLLEGAAMGKPLITTNLPGCRDVVTDGVNGFVIEPDSREELEKSVREFTDLSEEERENMGLQSRNIVEERFNRWIVVQRYMDEIETVTKNQS